jgi:exopolyphosphatase / guanosine-5'-triphosphate,3'-diphosphate pyrophosphatase
MQELTRTAPVTVGVVDIGSNTVHLIVARTDGNEIEILADEKDMTHLGNDVSFEGEISKPKFEQTLRLLTNFKRIAESKNAPLIVTGTEPLRAAHNAVKLVQQGMEKGIQINVLSQEEEAVLSFRGATHGMTFPSHFLVADIGGGSTEIIIITFNQISQIVKIPVGSIKLRAICKAGDPLTPEQVSLAQFKLGEIFAKANWNDETIYPRFALMAGGNAKAVTRLFNRGRRGEMLTRSNIVQAVNTATHKSSIAIAQEFNLVPSRAQTIGTGALIVGAIMDKLSLDNVHVSKYGIREGIILSYAHFREHWLTSLKEGRITNSER